MTTAQKHDYSTAPFGVWDTASTEDTVMADEREAAINRLLRPTVGATSREQAAVLVDEIGVDTIRSESDELLAARVANPDSVVAAPDQAIIAEVLAEVGDDPAKAQVALDAERAGKGRVTLISALEAIVSTPVGTSDGEAGAQTGVEVPEATSLAADPAADDEAAREAVEDGAGGAETPPAE